MELSRSISFLFSSIFKKPFDYLFRTKKYDTSYQYFGPFKWRWPEPHDKPRYIPSIDDNLILNF